MNKTVGSIRNQNCLIVGCGYVGQRLAARLAAESTTGLVRTAQSAEALQRQGVEPLILDLDQPLSPLTRHWQEIYYFAPPPKQGQQDTRLTFFLHALGAQTPDIRLVYLGTTGVYGDCAGAWVDEQHPVKPQVDRALRRHDAEQQLHQWRTKTGNEVVLLRVAGIYGPNKLPLSRLRQHKPMISPEFAPWTNRIHVDDLVQVCMAAMARGKDREIYNVSDGQPGNMADYFNQVADAAGLPRPPLVSADETAGQLSSGLRSYLAESRRIDNRKMLQDLHIQLKYSTLAQGLDHSLSADNI